MKRTTRINKAPISILATVCVSLLLTACGGGDMLPEEQAADAQAQSQVEAHAQGQMQPQPTAPNSANPSGQNTYIPAPSSSDEIKTGFNPSIWDQHSWTECNCGRNPGASASSTPWSTSSN